MSPIETGRQVYPWLPLQRSAPGRLFAISPVVLGPIIPRTINAGGPERRIGLLANTTPVAYTKMMATAIMPAARLEPLDRPWQKRYARKAPRWPHASRPVRLCGE